MAWTLILYFRSNSLTLLKWYPSYLRTTDHTMELCGVFRGLGQMFGCSCLTTLNTGFHDVYWVSFFKFQIFALITILTVSVAARQFCFDIRYCHFRNFSCETYLALGRKMFSLSNIHCRVAWFAKGTNFCTMWTSFHMLQILGPFETTVGFFKYGRSNLNIGFVFFSSLLLCAFTNKVL